MLMYVHTVCMYDIHTYVDVYIYIYCIHILYNTQYSWWGEIWLSTSVERSMVGTPINLVWGLTISTSPAVIVLTIHHRSTQHHRSNPLMHSCIPYFPLYPSPCPSSSSSWSSHHGPSSEDTLSRGCQVRTRSNQGVVVLLQVVVVVVVVTSHPRMKGQSSRNQLQKEKEINHKLYT